MICNDRTSSDDERSLAAACEMPVPTNNGPWAVEEVDYMLALIETFKAGNLDLKNGTTLRSFLAKMLSCKAKRISKRFEGLSIQGIGYNGRQTYKRSTEVNAAQAREARDHLGRLEWRYLKSEVKSMSVVSGCSAARKTLMVRQETGKRDAGYDSVSSSDSLSEASRPCKKRNINFSVLQPATTAIGKGTVASLDSCDAVSNTAGVTTTLGTTIVPHWLDSLSSNGGTKSFPGSLIAGSTGDMSPAVMETKSLVNQTAVPTERSNRPHYQAGFPSGASRFDSSVNRYVL